MSSQTIPLSGLTRTGTVTGTTNSDSKGTPSPRTRASPRTETVTVTGTTQTGALQTSSPPIQCSGLTRTGTVTVTTNSGSKAMVAPMNGGPPRLAPMAVPIMMGMAFQTSRMRSQTMETTGWTATGTVTPTARRTVKTPLYSSTSERSRATTSPSTELSGAMSMRMGGAIIQTAP